MNVRLRIRLFVLVALIGLFFWQRARRLEQVRSERASGPSGSVTVDLPPAKR